MIEVLHVASRAIGVVLPAFGVWGFAELRGGAPEGSFGTFFVAMGLSLLAVATWSGNDARRVPFNRVLTRWIATAVVVGGGLGFGGTVVSPGSPPGPQRTAEAITASLFYGVPVLVAAAVGLAVVVTAGAAQD